MTASVDAVPDSANRSTERRGKAYEASVSPARAVNEKRSANAMEELDPQFRPHGGTLTVASRRPAGCGVRSWRTQTEVEPGHEPELSPVLADLSGLPPALFTIGTLDPLLDENLNMAVRWEAAGNQTDLAVYPGGFHSFDSFPSGIAQETKDHIHTWVEDRIGEAVED